MRINFKVVNYFYLATLLLMLSIGGLIQEKLKYTGYVITELGLILFPVFLYIVINNFNLRHIFKFNNIKAKDIFMACLIAFTLWVLSESISVVWVFFIQKIITISALPITPSNNIVTLLLQIIVIAIIPSICEEMYFRGFILTGYMEFGIKKAILMSGVLFGLLHLNIATIPSMIILGMVLAYTVYKTGSIFISMLIHFLNNTVSILIMTYNNTSGIQNTSINITSMILWLVFGILGALILKYLLKHIGKNLYESNNESSNLEFIKKAILHWPILLSFSIIIIYLILYNFFGYIVE